MDKFITNSSPVILERIISGGQTGADVAALRAARAFNDKHKSEIIKTGGMCPARFMTVAGPNPDLAKFGLTPLKDDGSPITEQYKSRSMMNILNSDATLAFRFKSSAGTDCSISYATTKNWAMLKKTGIRNGETPITSFKPILVITYLGSSTWGLIPKIRAFLIRHKVHTLNVCGNRDVKNESEIQDFLEILFTNLFKSSE